MSIELTIASHISNTSSTVTQRRIEQFQTNHCVVLDDLFPQSIFELLRTEANQLMEQEAKRREVIIQESGNTPRAYLSVGRDAIARNGIYVPAVFHSEALRSYLSCIAGERLTKVPYQAEEFIINRQESTGDTHGWHWDDYGYAFIIVVESPDPLSGGRVELVPRVEWSRDDTENYLRKILSEMPVLGCHISAGHCYLMKTDTTLHRISPLTTSSRRTAVIYTYASPSDLMSTTITHGSMEDIYPEDTANARVR